MEPVHSASRMATFPHENLPKRTLSFAQLCAEAKRLQSETYPLPPNPTSQSRDFHLANLLLAGRLLEQDGSTSRVFIEEPSVYPEDLSEENDPTERAYGAMIGAVKVLNLKASLMVNPYPLSYKRMKNIPKMTIKCNLGVSVTLVL